MRAQEGTEDFATYCALPPAGTVTYLQKYDFATDYFYGSNDLRREGGDGYIRKSAT